MRIPMSRLQHWQITLILFCPIFIGLHFEDHFYKDLMNKLPVAFVFVFLFSVGDALYEVRPIKRQNFFRFNCFYLTIMTLLTINNFSGLLNQRGVYVAIGLMIYYFFAYIQVTEHCALLLRQAEGKVITDYEHQYDFMLFFMFPIGIWFLEPRINAIQQRHRE